MPNSYKANDKTVCSHYGSIILFGVVYMMLARLLAKRFGPMIESNLGEYQSWFRIGRSTVVQICILHQIFEKCYEYKVYLYKRYINYKQAYDSVDRTGVYQILQEFWISPNIIRMVRLSVKDTKAVMKVEGDKSSNFVLKKGVWIKTVVFNFLQFNSFFKTGIKISFPTSLFNMVLERVVR